MRRMTCVGGTWDENKRERKVEGFLFYNTSVALFLPIMSSSSLSEDIFRARNALCFGGVAFFACSASNPAYAGGHMGCMDPYHERLNTYI